MNTHRYMIYNFILFTHLINILYLFQGVEGGKIAGIVSGAVFGGAALLLICVVLCCTVYCCYVTRDTSHETRLRVRPPRVVRCGQLEGQRPNNLSQWS